MNLFSNRKKYYIIFCIKEHGMYTRVKKKRFNPVKAKISYKKKTFVIDVNKPTYSRKLNIFYFVNLYGDCQISFDDSGEAVNSDFIDLILHKHALQDLASRLTANAWMFNLLVFVVGAIIGALIGYIVAINIPADSGGVAP